VSETCPTRDTAAKESAHAKLLSGYRLLNAEIPELEPKLFFPKKKIIKPKQKQKFSQ